MASSYPGSLDNLATNKQDDTNAATGADMGVSSSVGDHATHHNDIADAINKIEAELGTNPSGTRHSTVAANLLELNNYITFVRVATNGIDTTSLPATIDGVTMASGDRFLETNNATAGDNPPTAASNVGIWEYTSAGAAATRPADFPAGTAKIPPVVIAVEGNVNTHSDVSGKGIYVATVSSLNPNTTSHYWAKLYAAAQTDTSTTPVTTSFRDFWGGSSFRHFTLLQSGFSIGTENGTNPIAISHGANITADTTITADTSGKSFMTYTGTGGHVITFPANNTMVSSSYPLLYFIRNEGTGSVLLAPGSGSTLNGSTNRIALRPGDAAICDGGQTNTTVYIFSRWLNPIAREDIENLIEDQIKDNEMVTRNKMFNRILGEDGVLFSRHSSATQPNLAETGTPMDVTTANNMVDGVLRFYGLWLPEAATITGVRWSQSVQGAYTADNNNKVGLYRSDGTNLILVASSTNDGNIWKAAVGVGSKAFSSTYLAEAGNYWVACLYNSSAQTTAPQQECFPNPLSDIMNTIGLGTNEGWNGYLSGQTDLPASTAWSGINKGSPRVRAFVALF